MKSARPADVTELNSNPTIISKEQIPHRPAASHRPAPTTTLSAFYLHGDAAAPLQVIARSEGDGGGDGRRRAGFQAVAGTNELRQGLQGVDPQLNKLALECKRAQRSAGSLGRRRN